MVFNIKKWSKEVLKILLIDRSTNKNIIWATNDYEDMGNEYCCEKTIEYHLITGENINVIKPGVLKLFENKKSRIKSKAEVFTPSWVCNLQNNLVDNSWFSRKNIFNIEKEKTWESIKNKVEFPPNKTWQYYINDNRLEITCGEAPYLVSRYDTVSGSLIDLSERIGILDRKMRIVKENTKNEKEWLKWAEKAFQSIYGFEFQGDNLLIARENLLASYCDYMIDALNREPTEKELIKIAKIISWNLWQMDGLTYMIPYKTTSKLEKQISLFENIEKTENIFCVIKDWKSNEKVLFKDLIHNTTIVNKNNIMFSVIIGNPPYQKKGGSGGNNDSPLYQFFVEDSYKLNPQYISFIIPSRWFSAGSDNLLGEFRKLMLTCNQVKNMRVFTNGKDVFPNVEIKGGVCYFLLDKNYLGKCIYKLDSQLEYLRKLDEFDILIRDNTLSSIVKKINEKSTTSLSDLISNNTPFRIPSNPKTSKKTPFMVYGDNTLYSTKLYLIENQKRKIGYVNRDEIIKNKEYIDSWKVFIPGSGGSGNDQMILGRPELAEPNSVCSQSYLFASFSSREEAKNFFNYIHTKFLRILVSAIKITQSAPKKAYRFVPIQDFTTHSDIDWDRPINEIDKQLFKKYSLTDFEIEYILSKLKEL